MSERVSIQTVQRIPGIVTCVGMLPYISLSEKGQLEAIHYIVSRVVKDHRDVTYLQEVIEEKCLDMDKALEVYDYYIARQDPILTFLLCLEEGVI